MEARQDGRLQDEDKVSLGASTHWNLIERKRRPTSKRSCRRQAGVGGIQRGTHSRNQEEAKGTNLVEMEAAVGNEGRSARFPRVDRATVETRLNLPLRLFGFLSFTLNDFTYYLTLPL